MPPQSPPYSGPPSHHRAINLPHNPHLIGEYQKFNPLFYFVLSLNTQCCLFYENDLKINRNKWEKRTLGAFWNKVLF